MGELAQSRSASGTPTASCRHLSLDQAEDELRPSYSRQLLRREKSSHRYTKCLPSQDCCSFIHFVFTMRRHILMPRSAHPAIFRSLIACVESRRPALVFCSHHAQPIFEDRHRLESLTCSVSMIEQQIWRREAETDLSSNQADSESGQSSGTSLLS
ncbi:hypothetical protein SRHO_G00302810 [Serrasalmus rhombeus]